MTSMVKNGFKKRVLSFIKRDLGARHKDTKFELQHPAPFSFQDVGRLIRFFTKENEIVLDPF